MLHVAINESVDTVSLLSELNNNNDEETSEWVCTPYTISEQDSSYGITVFEIEMDQTTTKVIPIDRIIYNEKYSLLATVINDLPTSSIVTTNRIITSSSNIITSSSITTSSSISESSVLQLSVTSESIKRSISSSAATLELNHDNIKWIISVVSTRLA